MTLLILMFEKWQKSRMDKNGWNCELKRTNLLLFFGHFPLLWSYSCFRLPLKEKFNHIGHWKSKIINNNIVRLLFCFHSISKCNYCCYLIETFYLIRRRRSKNYATGQTKHQHHQCRYQRMASWEILIKLVRYHNAEVVVCGSISIEVLAMK